MATEVEVKPHVTFNLTSTCLEGTRKAAVRDLSPPPRSALVKQHGFDVRPGAALTFCATAGVEEVNSGVSDNSTWNLPSPGVGFRTPGVKGLLDLSNASSGTPGACSLSSTFDTSPNAHIEVTATAHVTPGVQRLVKAVKRGLRACQEPEAAEQGLGGTYFFMNEAGRKVAIMKPCDEEPLAPNNPKGFVGRNLGDLGLKPTVRVGEAAMREVAAYLLDHDNWAKVPHTGLVKVAHPVFHYGPAGTGAAAPVLRTAGSSRSSLGTALSSGDLESMQSITLAGGGGVLPCKVGSLQQFVTHDCDTSEVGARRFSAKDVRRIGILDVRLLNTDRHAGNMLVRKPRTGSSNNLGALARLDDQQLELVPIDHGFCLPEALEPPYFEWLYWPQAMIPFDEEELDYIAHLDVAHDCQLLRENLPNLPTGCHRMLEVSTLLLQKCAAAGLTLFEIGTVLSRPLVGMEEELSELEKAAAAARDALEARREAGAEADSEEGSDSGISSDEECGEDTEFHLDGCSMPGAAASACRSAFEPEQLLFTFEDERGSSCSGSPAPSPVRQAVCFSAGSDYSGAPAMSVDGPRGSGAIPESPFAAFAAQGIALPGEEAGGIAKSLCPGAGFSSAHHAAARRARRRSHSHVVSKQRKAARYPPPVRATSPEAVSALFDGLEDEDDWREFVALLGEQIDAALRSGAWRTAASAQQNPAMSCPKF